MQMSTNYEKLEKTKADVLCVLRGLIYSACSANNFLVSIRND
jgi:hypothetical protein